jgi:DNA-binding NtrC family response regulator
VTNVNVVIYGETGTGKELAARALHEASLRAAKPFVVFDCGNVDPEFIRSELFGHEVGAFTGATGQRVGAFELANGGTLFMDEIGELPLDLQPKLLRVLEQREIQRLGASAPRKVDVRIVSATHRNLEQMVREGKYREDLFYRLCQVPVTLPPLRERPEDIPKLVAHFLELAQGRSRSRLQFAPEALSVLEASEWRGNVRELRNVVERALALSTGPSITVGDLLMPAMPGPGAISLGLPGGLAAGDNSPSLANRALEDIEREAILKTLKANNGNRKKTARILGIAPVTLREKLRRYGVDTGAQAAGSDDDDS